MSSSVVLSRSRFRRLLRSRAGVAVQTCAACMTLALVVWLAWRWYDGSRRSVLILWSEEPVGVELFAAGDREHPLLSRDLVQSEQIRLPAGTYDLQIVGQGRVGDVLTFDLDAQQDSRTVITSLDHLQYCEPFTESAYLIPLELAGRAAFLAVSPEGLRLIESAANRAGEGAALWAQQIEGPFPARWTLDLREPERLGLPPGFDWARNWDWVRGASDQLDRDAHLPRVVTPCSDLDRDGVPDIVVAGAGQAWLAAISALSGQLLWFVGGGEDLATSNDSMLGAAASTVVDRPRLLDDVDGDGVVDFLATFFERRPTETRTERSTSQVEMISGATGDRIWRYEVPPEWLETGEETAMWPLWHALRPARPHFPDLQDGGDRRTCFTPHAARPVAWGGERVAAIVAGDHGTLLHLKTGEAVDQPFVFDTLAPGDISWSDVDDDGFADFVAWMRTDTERRSIAAHSLRLRRPLWSYEPTPLVIQVQAHGASVTGNDQLQEDLDQDGVDDWLILGASSSLQELLVVVDGRTGAERWRRRLPTARNLASQIRLLVGPDVDGDGRREVYLSSPFEAGDTHRLQAFSGADGRELWRRELPHAAVSIAPDARVPWTHGPEVVTQIGWWQSGADGWPQLVVRRNMRGLRHRQTAGTWLTCLSSGTGQVNFAGRDVDHFLASDLDGDGVEELLTFREARRGTNTENRGEWRVTQGTAAARWRRPMGDFSPLADLNGDGCGDVLLNDSYHVARALDGRTGRELWRASFLERDDAVFADVGYMQNPDSYSAIRHVTRLDGLADTTRLDTGDSDEVPRRYGDFDGDGVPDLVRRTGNHAQHGRWLISGRTGRVHRMSVRQDFQVIREWAVDLNGDDRDEWLVVEESQTERRLVARSRNSLQPLWTYRLPMTTSGEWFLRRDHFASFSLETPLLADCNDDGVPDVVTVGWLEDDPREERWGWTALNGRTGAVLWQLDAQPPGEPPLGLGIGRCSLAVRAFGADERPTLFLFADIDRREDDAGKGAGPESSLPTFVLDAVDAVSGRRLWRWNSAPGPWWHRPASAWPLRTKQGVRGLAIHEPAHGAYAYVDEQGRTTRHIWRKAAPGRNGDESRFVAWDVDQDGEDELIACAPDGLHVLRPVTGEVVRNTSFASQRQAPALQTANSQEGVAPRWLTSARSIAAHECAEGEQVWSCPAPAGKVLYWSSDGLALTLGARRPSSIDRLETVSSEFLPHILFQLDDVATVRQAARTPTPRDVGVATLVPRNSRILGDAWRNWGVDRAPPPASPGFDLRLSRPLPWDWRGDLSERLENRREWWGDRASLHSIRFVRPVVRRVLLSLALVVGPLTWLAFVVRRRRFSLRTLLAVPAIVGGVLTIGAWSDGYFLRDAWFDEIIDVPFGGSNLRIVGAMAGSGWRLRWSLAVLYAPPVAAVGWWLTTLVRRRWKQAALGLGVWLFGATVAAVTLLSLDMHARPLASDESYSWYGWSTILWPGLMATAWCLVPLAPLVFLFRRLARRRAGS